MIVLLTGGGIGIVVYGVSGGFETHTEYGRKVLKTDLPEYQGGVRAYRMGLPANANPYQGASLDSGRHASEMWLAGWMDAKENAK